MEEFIEKVSGGAKRAEDKEAESQSGQKRVLELSLTYKRNRIAGESNGAHNKLDEFQQTIFLEGMFLVKMVLYSISWLFKLIGSGLLAQMKAKSKAVKWKLLFLKYHRKIHFILVMSSILDISFFGTRILLHRRNSEIGRIVKGYVGLMYTLLIADLLEIGLVSTRIKYQPEAGEDKNSQNHNKNQQKKNIVNNSSGLT